MPTSSAAELWETIAAGAERESPLWAAALRPADDRDAEPVFSPLAEPRYALGIETIYEGYLAHYGRSRLFASDDANTRLLLGDYLYAHGLVRIAAEGSAAAVGDLAELLAVCAHLRAEDAPGDGAAWAATAALLAQERLDDARAALRDDGDPEPLLELARAAVGEESVQRALAAHAERVG